MSKTENLTKRTQNLYIKAYAILCVILLGVMGYYTYNNWTNYVSLNAQAKQSEILISSLQGEASDEKAEYEELEDQFDKLNEDIAQNLKSVFPLEDDYTELVRQMDAIEEDLATRNNPFEVATLDFQNPREVDNYAVLPFRMSIKSSANNFEKFLQIIENSGSLNSDLRLMDISSIRLNFQDSDDTARGKIISFTVQINAYFQ